MLGGCALVGDNGAVGEDIDEVICCSRETGAVQFLDATSICQCLALDNSELVVHTACRPSIPPQFLQAVKLLCRWSWQQTPRS